MRSSKSIITGVAVLAALALPMVAGAADTNEPKLIVKDSTGSVDRMVVTDMGRVGVGISAPISAINVVGNTFPTTQITAHWKGTYALNGGGGFVGLYNTDAAGLPKINDRLGYFLFGTENASSKIIGAGLNFKAEKDWSGTSAPGYISFVTAPENSITVAERMRISSAGNVKIGSGTPTQRLDVDGGIKLVTSTTKPECSSATAATTRGTLWFSRNYTTGVADTLEVCAKDAAGTYGWRKLF